MDDVGNLDMKTLSPFTELPALWIYPRFACKPGLVFLPVLLTILLLAGCEGDSSSGDDNNVRFIGTTRSFYMGFTPWLYEATNSALETTYSRLVNHGDIIKHHLLGGIPWQEALDGSAYHSNLEAEIQGRLDRTPSNTEVFLAIDSLDSSRTALAPNRGESDNMPLPGAWATRSWSSDEVIDAYLAYATDMITRFQPKYFEYGTEISELLVNDPAAFSDYLVFAEAVYTSLKSSFPDLQVMVSIALKSPGSAEMQAIEANIAAVLSYSDIVGISVYPYVFFSHLDRGDPANLPDNWLSQVENFAAGKPLAISETGWIGEDLEISDFSYSESSNQSKQNAYLEELLETAEQLGMPFVIWWTATDFDTLWTDTLGEDPLAKIWKDIGLYDENQIPRTALATWDAWFAKDLSD